MSGVVDRIDRFQERHPVVSFPLAVVYKFFDDQGNYLAATLTYYAFVAIFPLMLLGTSILGFVLDGRPAWQEDILDSALSQFPIIGDELGRPQGLSGSVSGVLVGSLAALYGALGLGQALQNTMHAVWSVPRNSRPNPIYSRVKSLLLILTAGTSLLAVTIVSAVASTTDTFSQWLDASLRWLLPVITVIVVGCGLTALFRFAATGQHSFRRAAPGGFTLAILWQGLQYVGAAYVAAVLVGTTSMTKTFGLVLGLVGFIFIASVMAVLAMEVNVVIARQLYPRALLAPFTDNVHLTRADRRAYTGYAQMQRHKGFERVEVVFADRTAEPDERGPHEGPDPGPEEP
ncbi:YihY/virulence factor BrkB family protein [Nocardioides sp. InS609-2]|uniref:YihY/virulence factor BrkB family protein n=1 Tax=Nocardioides sp. InS609-2 TaxID=2760705 RepID=UPI0020C01538|nr:YihY/virulence factor BrkB family protein [Nocardioides sp. InS609-2]